MPKDFQKNFVFILKMHRTEATTLKAGVRHSCFCCKSKQSRMCSLNMKNKYKVLSKGLGHFLIFMVLSRRYFDVKITLRTQYIESNFFVNVYGISIKYCNFQHCF